MDLKGDGALKKEKTKANKVGKLQKVLRVERERSKEYLNRLKYLQADFENYRKRIEKETQEAVKRSNERLITNLLGVIDELEIAIRSGKETENKEALLEGVEMVLKKMYTTLQLEGLAKIEAVGKPFDPNRHEVVLRVPTKDHAEGTVIEEVRKGFMFKDKVIRPTMVKVAQAYPTQDRSAPKESGQNG